MYSNSIGPRKDDEYDRVLFPGRVSNEKRRGADGGLRRDLLIRHSLEKNIQKVQ